MKQLETILSQYNRPIRITERIEAPQCIRYHVEPLRRKLVRDGNGPGTGAMTRISHLSSLAPDIAAQLGVKSVLVSQNGGIWLEVAKVQPDTVYASDYPPQVGGSVVLGQSVTGETVRLNLSDPRHAHVLISGTTGSGKSALIDAMIYSLSQEPTELRLQLIDPHGEMAKWRWALSVDEYARSSLDALVLLRLAGNAARTRLNSGSWNTRFVIIVDEFASLLQSEHGKGIEKELTWLLAEARKAGINIVMATQHPGHEVCKAMMKVNFPVRIGMTLMSWQDSMVALGMKGAEKLNGRGDAILRVGGELTRFQGAFVLPGEEWNVMQKPLPRKKVSAPGKKPKGGPVGNGSRE